MNQAALHKHLDESISNIGSGQPLSKQLLTHKAQRDKKREMKKQQRKLDFQQAEALKWEQVDL